ncbi:precorrin-6y C5,15-methyltransferase (decarboxylating) subunit CbiE [uncultured Anaeromusa sp.]|uniref:precorrin-6y C5,15-methyltransferase (decarboxylating) subunit CbiE n=1 Tax=uncultured Anaeromusa sp. TaxID=673273 RepID=UPI0029C6DCF6|nr:precorrin-6y C5,15-methyltransferase (decarboxylating) subunit CbiE [uncultured Anaeromusa sp.]
MEHQILVVGIGPGSREYMLPAAWEAIATAKTLVGGRRALETLAPPEAKRRVVDADIEGLLNYIEEESRQGQVVVMVSGDPGFYSLLPALRRRFPRERLQVIPGISSVQLAFARVAEPWQDASLLSFHGREIADEVLLYRSGRMLSFLTDRLHRPKEIAERLLQLGWPETTLCWQCESLSYSAERVERSTLAKAAQQEGFAHAIFIVKAAAGGEEEFA